MPTLEHLLARPEILADPYPTYRELRARGPYREADRWVVTGFQDCRDLLRHAHLGKPPVGEPPPGLEPLFEMRHRWLARLNPPDHTRLRGLIQQAFAPRVVERLRGFVQATCDELIERAVARGRMELIEDFAYPLPLVVISHILGVPAEDRATFRAWAQDIIRGTATLAEDEERRTAAASAAEFIDYFRELVERRGRDPEGDDLLAQLIRARKDGALDLDELYGICTLLTFAGHETTTNLIGNGLLALLRNPDQRLRLREDPGLIESAVEELLRYDSPVQKVSRHVLQDVDGERWSMREGEAVVFLLGAANRDPDRFADPDALDIARADNKHLAFGNGIHFCPGGALAALEGKIAFRALMELEGLELVEEPTYRPHASLRGLSSLVVSFDARTSTPVPGPSGKGPTMSGATRDLRPAIERATRYLKARLAAGEYFLSCVAARTASPWPDGKGHLFAAFFISEALGDDLSESERALLRARIDAESRDGYWAYSVDAHPGAISSDDTAFVLRCAHNLGFDEPVERMLRFYKEPEAAPRGFTTFLNLIPDQPRLAFEQTMDNHRQFHPEVNANVFLLIAGTALAGRIDPELIRRSQTPEGWWHSYCYPSRYYATSMFLELLRNDIGLADARERGLAFLVRSQNDDGSWGTPGDPYETALAANALAVCGRHPGALGRAVDFLLEHQEEDGSWATPKVIWEWLEGEGDRWEAFDVHGVVATALASLALQRAGESGGR